MYAATASIPLPKQNPTVAFWPLFTWLALQMLALLAAAFRIPFSARFIVPEEQLALHEMFTVQMIASALLFPLLFRTRATALLVIAATPLMAQLAGVLAAQTNMIPLTFACAYPTLWVIGLGLWSYALGDAPKAKLYGVAAASLLVIGGALVAYLDREFGAPAQTFDWASHGYQGPLVGGMTLVEAGARTGTVWVFMGTFLLSGLIATAARGWIGRNPRNQT
jgi:hypothetical protein